jgi:hypothetical protein
VTGFDASCPTASIIRSRSRLAQESSPDHIGLRDQPKTRLTGRDAARKRDTRTRKLTPPGGIGRVVQMTMCDVMRMPVRMKDNSVYCSGGRTT